MTRRIVAVLALAMAALLPAAAVALAAPAQEGSAFVRLAHLSPDTPDVDVYLASVSDPDLRFTVPGVGYGAVSDYRALPVGSYTVAMREAGAPADTPPVISTTLTTTDDAAYTVAGTGRYTDLGLQVLTDDRTMPGPGQARVRVINAAASAASVDIGLAGAPGTQPIAADVEFAGTTGYRAVPAGPWTLRVAAPGRPAVDTPVSVDANSVQTVLVLDGPDGFVAELHRDFAGAASVPVGSVATGFGGNTIGTAPFAVAGLVAALVAAGLGLRARVARR